MIKIVDTEDEILQLEQLRLDCIKSNRIIDNPRRTIFGNKMLEKESIGISLEENDEKIAGCIVSSYFNYLYIEWIFTNYDFRKKGYASKLLKFLENNLEMFRDYYSKDLDGIILEPYIAVEGFYKKNGYKFYNTIYMYKNISKNNKEKIIINKQK